MPHLKTLDDLGPSLPVGIEGPAGDRLLDYSFRPWRTSTELAVSKVRDRERTLTPAQTVSVVLAHLLRTWGGLDFDRLTEGERRLALARAYAADVYVAWVQLRRQVLGNEYEQRVTCGFCRHAFVYAVDLGSLEVRALDSDEEVSRPALLRDGLLYQGQERRVLTLRPVAWATYEGMAATFDVARLKLGVLAGAIWGIEGADRNPVRLVPEQIDLTKRDLEALVRAIDDEEPGPNLALDLACPSCGTPIRQALSWVYDPFFSARASGTGPRPTPSGKSCSSSPTRFPEPDSTSMPAPPRTDGTTSGCS
jgi:hypothetical protein